MFADLVWRAGLMHEYDSNNERKLGGSDLVGIESLWETISE